jgi:hypothetical protein
MVLWEQGSDGCFPGFEMGMTLADFQAVGKYPNIKMRLKRKVRWARALRERCHNIMAKIQSFPRVDLVLRNWIKESTNGLVRLVCRQSHIVI